MKLADEERIGTGKSTLAFEIWRSIEASITCQVSRICCLEGNRNEMKPIYLRSSCRRLTIAVLIVIYSVVCVLFFQRIPKLRAIQRFGNWKTRIVCQKAKDGGKYNDEGLPIEQQDKERFRRMGENLRIFWSTYCCKSCVNMLLMAQKMRIVDFYSAPSIWCYHTVS